MKDFFISYTQRDRDWAEWVAWQLEKEGFTTTLQAWDFRPGSNFVEAMHRGLKDAARVLPVLSPEYLSSEFGQVEWQAAFATNPNGKQSRVVPIRIRECKPDGLLALIVYEDLVGRSEEEARKVLLQAARQACGARGKPQGPPGFPGRADAKRKIETERPPFPPLIDKQRASSFHPQPVAALLAPRLVTRDDKDAFRDLCGDLISDLDRVDEESDWLHSRWIPIDVEVEVERGSKGREITDFLAAVRKHRQSQLLLIKGDPGSGKSVALRKLCRDELIALREGRRRPMPLYINLREWKVDQPWTEQNPPTESELCRFVFENAAERLTDQSRAFFERHFDAMLSEGRFYLVLDSFDEIPQVLDIDESTELIKALSRVIEQFVASGADRRGLVASRPYRRPSFSRSDLPVLDIRPFSERKIASAVDKAAENPDRVKRALFVERPHLVPAARRPFMLGLILEYANGHLGELPLSQAGLYESFVTRRLESNKALLAERSLAVADIVSCASVIAVAMFNSGRSGRDEGLEIPEATLRARLPDEPVADVIEILRRARLARRGVSHRAAFSFVHRRFHEYFLALHLQRRPGEVPLDAIPSDSRWRDALVLFTEVADEATAKQIAAKCIEEAALLVKIGDHTASQEVQRFFDTIGPAIGSFDKAVTDERTSLEALKRAYEIAFSPYEALNGYCRDSVSAIKKLHDYLASTDVDPKTLEDLLAQKEEMEDIERRLLAEKEAFEVQTRELLSPLDAWLKSLENALSPFTIIMSLNTSYRRSLHSLRFLADAFGGRRETLTEIESKLASAVMYLVRGSDLLAAKHAVEAAGVLSEEHAEDVVTTALESQDPWVVETAFRACRYMKGPSSNAQRSLQRVLITQNPLVFLQNYRDFQFSLQLADGFTAVQQTLSRRKLDIYLYFVAACLFVVSFPYFFLFSGIFYGSISYLINRLGKLSPCTSLIDSVETSFQMGAVMLGFVLIGVPTYEVAAYWQGSERATLQTATDAVAGALRIVVFQEPSIFYLAYKWLGQSAIGWLLWLGGILIVGVFCTLVLSKALHFFFFITYFEAAARRKVIAKKGWRALTSKKTLFVSTRVAAYAALVLVVIVYAPPTAVGWTALLLTSLVAVGWLVWAWKAARWDKSLLAMAARDFSPERPAIARKLAEFKTSRYRLKYVHWLERFVAEHKRYQDALSAPSNVWLFGRPNYRDDASRLLAQLDERWTGLDR